MKFAYFNPTVFAIEDIPADVFVQIQDIVNKAHGNSKFNDEGNPNISIRGGQQIQVVPSQFNVDIDFFREYVERISLEYFQNILQVNGQSELIEYKTQLVSAWTIKQSSGDYQAMHSHEAHISGNIYVEVPYLEENSKISDACLEFKLPIIKNHGAFHFVDNWKFKPQVMKMVIFPSYIPHTVYPWKGHGDRTILAWDAKLVKSN